MTDGQTLFNAAMVLVGVFGGYYMNSVKDSIKALQSTDQLLITKLQAVELLVAGTYIKRPDMDKITDALFAKLDKIEAKLDAKADKAACEQHHILRREGGHQ
jgi:hypothetical protein